MRLGLRTPAMSEANGCSTSHHQAAAALSQAYQPTVGVCLPALADRREIQLCNVPTRFGGR